MDAAELYDRYADLRREGFDGWGAKPWTAERLVAVLPLRPEDVLLGFGGGGDIRGKVEPHKTARLRWRWYDYAQRLVWSYGFDEALRRLSGSPEPEARAA